MWLHPTEFGRDDVSCRTSGAHRPGVDVDQGGGPRCPYIDSVEFIVVSQQIQYVGRIRPVQHRQRRRQTQGFAVTGDQLMGNGMEGAALQSAAGVVPGAHRRGPGQHVVGGATGEGQQQHPLRRHPAIDQAGDPRGECPGLPGARTGQDDERPVAVRGGRQLCVVEPGVPPLIEHTSDSTAWWRAYRSVSVAVSGEASVPRRQVGRPPP